MAKIFETPFAINGDKEAIPEAVQSSGRVSFSMGFGPDYEKPLLTDPSAKDLERKKLNWILNAFCNAINKLQEDGGGLVGVPVAYPSSTVIPTGYIPYDGRKFDTAANPLLARLFPSGFLADIRGLVIRGLDAGRGVDPNRAILSYQEDAMQRILGSFAADVANTRNINLNVSGAFYDNGSLGAPSDAGIVWENEIRDFRFDSSRVVRTADETRMKNIAFYYITKVG